MTTEVDFKLIETADALQEFYSENANVEWIALDTEFIGEKRFETLLCLVQVASPKGFYLIDPLKLPDIQLFLQLLENEAILKITHAGENDYRLLNQNFGIIPRNVFDTQIAAGFLGHGYPASYSRLIEKELNHSIDKGYAATDWEARPLKLKQLEYALSDVIYLYALYENLTRKMTKKGRAHWAKAEMFRWETPQYYVRDPHREALMNTLMNGLKEQKQIFLIRLYEWRRLEAQKSNVSKEMILPAKFIAPILRGIDGGKQALMDSRILPDKLIAQNWETFKNLLRNPAEESELVLLERLPKSVKEDPRRDISMELLHILVKYRCMESGIAPTLVFHKSDLTHAEAGEDIFDIENDWRKEFLGEAIVKWLNARGELNVQMENDQVLITMRN